MKKNVYQAPEMEVVKMMSKAVMLAGSGKGETPEWPGETPDPSDN